MLIELYDVALSPQTAGAIEQTGRAAAAAAAAAEISLNAAAATLSSRQRCAVFSHEKKRTKKKKCRPILHSSTDKMFLLPLPPL